MSVTLLPATGPTGLLELYVDQQHLLGGAASWRRDRVTAARAFLRDHPDLDVWMVEPLDARLVELQRRRQGTWPFIGFAILTGACRADADFLFAKNFGHSMARWTAGLFRDDVAALSEAAARLGVPTQTATAWLQRAVPMAVAFTGRAPSQLTVDDLDALDVAVANTQRMTTHMRHGWSSYVFGLRQLLFEARVIDAPAVRSRGGGRATREARLAVVAAPEIRRTLLAYIDARAAVLRPKSIEKITSALAIFGEFLGSRFPELTSTAQLERHHIEAFMTWTSTRSGRGTHDRVHQVGPSTIAHAVITLRTFLDDIAAWGWTQSPPRRLVFPTDIPHQPELLPRALPPDVDAAVMAAVAELEDPFARTGLTIMRGTGLRIGELLDLELDCIVDYGPSGSWLRVPLGKLNNERAVPLDAPTLAVLDGWFDQRQHQRALPHPRDGRLADFVFVERGRHLGPSRLRSGLRHAVTAAGLTGTDGQPLHVVSHQLRHSYATSLVNAGMSLQALMALLGHRSPEMTIRYARLASPTLRDAYDQAIGKMRRLLPIASPGPSPVPDRVQWLNSEMLKTRVAHGYCSRALAAEACTYANICETCPSYTTTPEFTLAITDQLADIHALRDDAHQRGWTSEATRHQRVIDSLEGHLHRIGTSPVRTPHP